MKIIEEADLCIVCNKPGHQFSVKTEREDCWNNDVNVATGHGSVQTSFQRSGSDELLLPQLRVIFLLQQVFKQSLHDETVLETMQALGDPSGWFEICAGCSELVDSGIHVLRELRRYQKQRNRILEKLERSFSSSFWGEPWNIGDNYKFVSSQGGDKSRKRSEFRNKIRKIEPNCAVDGEIKHEPCESTNIPVEDDDDWASCDIGFEHPSTSKSYSPPLETSRNEEEESHQEGNASDQPNVRKLRPRIQKFQTPRSIEVRYNTRAQRAIKSASSPTTNATSECITRELSDTSPNDHQQENPVKKPKLGTPSLIKRQWSAPYTDPESEEEEPDFDDNIKNDPNYHGFIEKKESDEDRELRRLRKEQFKKASDEDRELRRLRKEQFKKEQEEKRRERLEKRREQRERKMRHLSKKGLKVFKKYHWFYKNCHEFLDLNLVKYPPSTSEDQSELADKKNSEPNWYLKEEGFPCTTCDRSFVNMFHTIAHIQAAHLGVEKPWKCNQCPYKDKGMSRFRFHVLDHKGPLQKCGLCSSFSCRRQENMDTHVINHQRGATNPTCNECQQSFHNIKQFVEHMTKQHGLSYHRNKVRRSINKKLKPPLVCQFCNKVWPNGNKLSLKFHLLKIHNHGELDERFQVCSECGDISINRTNLEIHMTRYHADKIENLEKFFCEHCGKEYKLESDLKSHLQLHREDPQTCHICGLEYMNPKRLRLHITKHHSEMLKMSPEELEEFKRKKNEEKPHGCNLCMERFPFSVLLYRHYRTCHPEVTEKFKCDICGKGFSRQCSVKRHKEAAHEKLKVACEDCGKTYPSSDGLRQHQRYHCPARKRKEATERRVPSSSINDQAFKQEEYVQQQPEVRPPFQPGMMTFHEEMNHI